MLDTKTLSAFLASPVPCMYQPPSRTSEPTYGETLPEKIVADLNSLVAKQDGSPRSITKQNGLVLAIQKQLCALIKAPCHLVVSRSFQIEVLLRAGESEIEVGFLDEDEPEQFTTASMLSGLPEPSPCMRDLEPEELQEQWDQKVLSLSATLFHLGVTECELSPAAKKKAADRLH